MASRVAALGYAGVAEEIFVEKLSAIHDMKLEKTAQTEKALWGKGDPEDKIEGNDSG